jgi:hypothetical protein
VNKAFLPINSRLRSLRAMSRVAPGGFRSIAAPPGADPLPALLREMNETVLGRTLTFESGSGSQMSLDVSGRRVLRLVSANGLAGAEACLAAETLDDENKDDLLKLFQALADPRQELRVASAPIVRSGEGMSVGLPVALLADLLLLDLNPPEDSADGGSDADGPPAEANLVPIPTTRPAPAPSAPPVPVAQPEPPVDPLPTALVPASVDSGLGKLAGSLGSLSMAWLVVGGADDGASDGAEEMVSHLRGFLDAETDAVRQQLDAMSATKGEPVCILLGAALVEGNSILCARIGDGLLLALIDGDATTHVLGAWRTVVG